MKTVFVLIITSIFSSCDQSSHKPSLSNMEEFEKLINSTMPFIESLINKHGEFYPLATALKLNDSIASVGVYDADDHPESSQAIADLKNALIKSKNEYKAVGIFYDVKVIDPNTNEKTDAVAVYLENNLDSTAFTLYYPYKISKDKEPIFSKSWKSLSPKEIFLN